MKTSLLKKSIFAPIVLSTLFFAAGPISLIIKYDVSHHNTFQKKSDSKDQNSSLLDSILSSWNLEGRVFAECSLNSGPSDCVTTLPTVCGVDEGSPSSASFTLIGNSSIGYYPTDASITPQTSGISLSPPSQNFNNYVGNPSDPAPASDTIPYNYDISASAVSITQDSGDASGPYSGQGRKYFNINFSAHFNQYSIGSWNPSNVSNDNQVYSVAIDHKNRGPVVDSATLLINGNNLMTSTVFTDEESNPISATYTLYNTDTNTQVSQSVVSAISSPTGATNNFTFMGSFPIGNYKYTVTGIESSHAGTCGGFSNYDAGINLSTSLVNSNVVNIFTPTPTTTPLPQDNIVLNSPINSQKISTLRPTLTWTKTGLPSATKYKIFLDGKNIFTQNITSSQFILNYDLADAHTWKIQALDTGNTVLYTTPEATFTIISPTSGFNFKLISPADGQNISDPTTVFIWENSTDNYISNYEIFLDGKFIGVTPKGTTTFSYPVTSGSHEWQVIGYRIGSDKFNKSVPLMSGSSNMNHFNVNIIGSTITTTSVAATGTPIITPTFSSTNTPTFTSTISTASTSKILGAENDRIFDHKDLSEILSIPVPAWIKITSQILIIVGYIFTFATLASPASFGLTSFHLFGSGFFLLLGRRQKKSWGVVYDEGNKKPIPFAVIKLYSESGKFLKDTVSDTVGRFVFAVDKGKYWMEVRAQGYQPISHRNEDFNAAFYRGENINIVDGDVALGVKIPLISENISAAENFFQKFKRNAPEYFRSLAIVIFVISLILFFVTSTAFNLFTVVVYFALSIYLFYNYTIVTKSVGILFEKNIDTRIKSAFVSILSTDAKNLVQDLILTDEKGRFPLLLDPGKYIVDVNLPEYKIDSVNEGNIISDNQANFTLQEKNRVKIGIKKL